MKKILLSFFMFLLCLGAEAQLSPMKVYNGLTVPINLRVVGVRNTITCASFTTSVINVVIPPGGTYVVAPLVPGNPNMDWAGAKITDLTNTSYIGAIHPYFASCWGTTSSSGPISMTDYWYPIGSSPYQVLKIY